jgi:signal transduction histidine kinase
LNNPLQTMQNALYLVKADPGLTQQSRQDLAATLDEANRMADLVLRLRETYRPTSGTEFTSVALADLVTEVHQLLRAHLRRNNTVFQFAPPPGLPALPLVRDQIKQVLLNLCFNAVEAMPAGGTLKVEIGLDAAASGMILAIADSGPGIEAADVPYIFDPFFTTKQGGTGLGLAISYDIIQRHRGKIEVISPPGQGATFRVWLPLEPDSSEHFTLSQPGAG